jgi:hypothetical protein
MAIPVGDPGPGRAGQPNDGRWGGKTGRHTLELALRLMTRDRGPQPQAFCPNEFERGAFQLVQTAVTRQRRQRASASAVATQCRVLGH